MLRKLALLVGAVLLASMAANAQDASDKVELFGGYSYMRADSGPGANLNGWELSGQYKVSNWLGGVADFDGHYGDGGSLHTFLFGPQVSWPARVSPFAHVLLGGAHVSSGGFGETAFAMAIGGGIDTRLVHGIYWRVIEGDYLPTHFGNAWENNARVSTGIVFRF
jgi:hypothetical protein